MILDPETETYDLNASGHVSLYATAPELANDLRDYFNRCNEQGIEANLDFTNEGYGLYANGAWEIIKKVAEECSIDMDSLTIHISDMFASYPCKTMPQVNDKWLDVYVPTTEPPGKISIFTEPPVSSRTSLANSFNICTSSDLVPSTDCTRMVTSLA